jgi:hypothetical protein
MKKLLKSKYTWFVICFVAGGICATFILPEKITIKKEKEIVEVEKVVEVEVEKVVVKEVVVHKKVRVVKRREVFPDGHIIEEEVYESEAEQIDRIAAEYKEKLAAKEAELKRKEMYLKEHLNPKPMYLYAGVGADPFNPLKPMYMAGVQKPIFGPIILGGFVDSNRNIGITLGVRF